MKKRLFLFVALIMAICAIFAISASADEVKIKNIDGEEITVTFYDDAPVKSTFVNSTNDYVIFDDGFACPSVYIFKDSTSISNGGWYDPGLKNALDFSFLESHGKSYTITNIVELDIPQGITTIGSHIAHGSETLKKVSFPNSVTSLGPTGFQNSTGLLECVFEHTENDGLTTIGQYMFYKCTNLRALSMPDCVTSMTGEGYHFAECSNLTALYLSKNLQTIESTRGASFNYCTKMYFVNEPFTTSDTAPAKPDVYYFPENLSSLPDSAVFGDDPALNNVLVFGKNVKSVPGMYTFERGGRITVVFLGNMETINTSFWTNTAKIIFANANDKSGTDIASYNNSKTTVFCASEADASKHLESPRNSEITPATCYSNKAGIVRCFCNLELSRGEYEGTMLTTHNYIDDFDCTTCNYCENYGEGKCDKYLEADATSHNEMHDVIFENGFTSAGVHNTYCSNATCKALTVIEDLDAMFTHEGYSFKAGALGGIDTRFKINSYAMKLYEQYEGVLHFGIVIANASHFENVDVFIENGELTSTNSQGSKSGIIVEMTSRDYDYFNCYLDGFDFNNEKHTALGLIIAGYVYGEDESDIAFIQKQYTTDSDDNTLETPYTATVTKGETVSVVNILAVRDFVPIISNDDE